MKKIILSSLIFSFLVPTISPAASAFSHHKIEKKEIDFTKEPAKYLGEIYNDYHFFKIDEGIKKAEKALKIIDKIYKKNPNAEIKDPSLNWKKAYQIKSTIHTLLGMLYFRKALDVATESKEKESEYLRKILKEKKELTDEDIEKLSKIAEKQRKILEVKSKKYANLSLDHFKKAIEVFPDNPYPHFQLAKFYLTAGERELAEKELVETAKIFVKWKDFKALNSLIDFLKEAGADTALIKKLEDLKRNNG
ncbi:MAG: hypothetical protein ABGX27_01970 [Desulfurobacteriaceae bacterium]